MCLQLLEHVRARPPFRLSELPERRGAFGIPLGRGLPFEDGKAAAELKFCAQYAEKIPQCGVRGLGAAQVAQPSRGLARFRPADHVYQPCRKTLFLEGESLLGGWGIYLRAPG